MVEQHYDGMGTFLKRGSLAHSFSSSVATGGIVPASISRVEPVCHQTELSSSSLDVVWLSRVPSVEGEGGAIIPFPDSGVSVSLIPASQPNVFVGEHK